MHFINQITCQVVPFLIQIHGVMWRVILMILLHVFEITYNLWYIFMNFSVVLGMTMNQCVQNLINIGQVFKEQSKKYLFPAWNET